MGFNDEKIERAFHYAEASSIEEVMYYIVPNSNGLWEHKFLPESHTLTGKDWFLCRRNKKLHDPKGPTKMKLKQNKSYSMMARSYDLEMASPWKEKDNLLNYELESKTIKNNLKFIDINSSYRATDELVISNSANPYSKINKFANDQSGNASLILFEKHNKSIELTPLNLK